MQFQSYRRLLVLGTLLGAGLVLTGCPVDPAKTTRSRMSYFIGIDVSGSFKRQPEFKDALRFLSYYTYAHINSAGEFKKPKAMFVGSVGGNYADDPQIFHSSFDLEGKSVTKINQDLQTWFGDKDRLTDFNTFFTSIAKLVKKRNLALSPITIIIVSDGIPEGMNVKKGSAGRRSYSKIDLGPVEYLARNVTVRLLYVSPKAGKNWEDFVERRRVRLWTVSREVMRGWSTQLVAGKPPAEQTKLFEWIKYNVDYRVRVKKF
ncbi:hypothetical protein KAR10_05600 [bacterium]|nr:hypothetical protein [bacterium]